MKRKRKVRIDYDLRILRTRAFHSQQGRCYWCCQLLSLEAADLPMAHGIHLRPPREGGKTEPGNVVAACFECSDKRSHAADHRKASDPDVFMTIGEETRRSPFEVLKRARGGD